MPRPSGADKDGAEASLAGQHLTLLDVPSAESRIAALKERVVASEFHQLSPVVEWECAAPA